MSKVIECPQCHQGNEFGRMFCQRCGTKLDMSRITAASGKAFELKSFLDAAWRIGLFLIMLVLVLLLIWPADNAGKRGEEKDVAALLGQREALKLAVHNGQDIKLEASELAINAYLAATLTQARSNEEAVAGWMMKLAELNVGLKAGAVTVTTVSHWGPLSITWQISGAPKVADKQFSLVVKSGRIGHLGLPQGGAEWMAARVAVMFNRWSADRELLNSVASVTAESGSVTLATRAAAAKE
ncbi:MAG: zinc ribbon domain-containing protein [Kiritimatiellaeota bacterium]|nr:zinc ribbon domain-containing protein [Kiritimatiellota bacterium]